MPEVLPAIRMDLDFMPSPVEEHPGLLIRDPLGYSDATLIIPPPLVALLANFDGEHTDLDLRQELVRLTGELDVSAIAGNLRGALHQAGFLHDEEYNRRREATEEAFRQAPERLPAHAGSGYPDEPEELSRFLNGTPPAEPRAALDGRLVGIAAPHVSPIGGMESYREAYFSLAGDLAGRTFVILGTSHYGAPNRFGLTRKPYRTPFGAARTDLDLVERLAAGAPGAAAMEDFCHSFEHTIEFQVVFLQSLFGPEISIVPVLCGSFGPSVREGGLPEDNDDVRAFLGTLGEVAAKERDRLVWVLGVDMAHMGARYQDQFHARAGEGVMQDVERRDRARIGRIAAGDARGFWEQVQEYQDDLKWCGSAPFYTFLKAVPEARGALLRYQQWNIDASSVVSFAGMAFHR